MFHTDPDVSELECGCCQVKEDGCLRKILQKSHVFRQLSKYSEVFSIQIVQHTLLPKAYVDF